MNCLNEEAIHRFIDGYMSEEEIEALSSHISECDKCMEEVMSAAVSDKKMLSKLKKAEKAAPRLSQRNGCLSNKLLLAYISAGLDDRSTQLVEAHLENCNPCLEQMVKLQKAFLKEAELSFDTTALISAMKESHPEDILTIVLKDIGKRVFEVIETTGTLLTTHSPAFEGARGTEPSPETNTIHVRKDFTDKGVSAEVAINKGEKPGTCDIRLSLMKMKGDKISGILESERVNLSGMGVEKDGVTDKKGEVEFKDLLMGNYRMVLDKDIAVAVEIKKNSQEN